MSKPWSAPTPRREAHTPPPLGPLLAGARARGVADGFAWLGLAAILIDDRGEALHVNPGAVELMGATLYLDAGRLRAREPRTNLALAEALSDALTLCEARNLRLEGPEGEMWAHIAPMAADADDPYQLLRAVVLLSRTREARH
jgi:hypothetical protein